MIAVTLYFPDEIEEAIKEFGHDVGVDVDRPVLPEYLLGQFFAGVLAASIAHGMRRPDLAQAFKALNYRHRETPEG